MAKSNELDMVYKTNTLRFQILFVFSGMRKGFLGKVGCATKSTWHVDRLTNVVNLIYWNKVIMPADQDKSYSEVLEAHFIKW
jgi:hypothetical protein